MEVQKDFGLVDSTEGEEDEELEQEKIAHQVEEGISFRHYKVMLVIFFHTLLMPYVYESSEISFRIESK